MSHFAVLLIRYADNPVPWEEALARYDENLEVEEYISKTYEEAAAAGKSTMDRLAEDDRVRSILDGATEEEWKEHHGIWGYECFKKAADLMEAHKNGELTEKDYHDFYCYDYCQGEDIDEEGNILSKYNPDSRWDWYEVGGRRDGELKIKRGRRREYGGASDANVALKQDIDWAAMNSITPEERDHAIKFWKYYVLKEPYPGTDEEKEKELGFCFYKPEYYLNRYKTVDGYLKSLSTWCLRAVLDNNGEWHEVGEMGWFGCSSESEDEAAKREEEFYDRFIKPLPDDATLTVIDCHI